MTYTTENSIGIQFLIKAFKDYIQASPHFDVLYTSKIGYLFLRIEKNFVEVDTIGTPKDLFERLLNEISSDVRDLFLCGEHITVDLFPAEIEETRNRMLLYIEQLPESLRGHYTTLMEEYFLHCNDIYDKDVN